LAGLWEFPGGKVEPGEADLAALHRECDEELGVRIEPGGRLGTDIALGVRKNSPEGTAVLRVWTARLLAGEVPQAREHLELRWLAAHQLGDVEWLPADLPLVEALREVLIHKV
jgi:8-oxo-dGTP diphosphatase